jgi:prepilin peptidase CpaA
MDDTYLYALTAVFGLYSLLLAVAAVCDAWRFVIPNAITVALVVLFVGTALLLPVEIDWISHLGAAAAVFVVSAGLFAWGKLGGGDAKLLTAVALWAGFDHLVELLFYVTVGGGALAFALIFARRAVMVWRMRRPTAPGASRFPRVLLVGEAVPYALAIAPAAIFIGLSLPHLGLFI